MIKVIILALLLQGAVSNENGRCGLLINKGSYCVTRVYKVGPSAGILKVGDKIVSSNGESHATNCLGPAGQVVHLVIERDGKEFEVDIVRAPVREVHD